MKTISATNLLALLKSTTSSFVSFVTETDPSFKKGGRSGLRSLRTLASVILPSIPKSPSSSPLWEPRWTMVLSARTEPRSRAMVRNPSWKSPALGVKRVDGVEVTHKGESYITCHFVANNKPEVSYKYEGKEITLTDVEKSYLPEKKISSSQADAGLTEANQIVHREYSLSSIKAVTIKGETYIVV